MRIRLLTITHKVPTWIKMGYDEYVKRIHSRYSLELIEIPAEKRFIHSDLAHIMEKEGKKMLSVIKSDNYAIALDRQGKQWSTEQLSKNLSQLQQQGNNIDFLVGGPEGLSPLCLQRARETWSLSLLTFPHALVRVIIAEQLYRAISLLNNHPYHR